VQVLVSYPTPTTVLNTRVPPSIATVASVPLGLAQGIQIENWLHLAPQMGLAGRRRHSAHVATNLSM
jgi:hypothetical protein